MIQPKMWPKKAGHLNAFEKINWANVKSIPRFWAKKCLNLNKFVKDLEQLGCQTR